MQLCDKIGDNFDLNLFLISAVPRALIRLVDFVILHKFTFAFCCSTLRALLYFSFCKGMHVFSVHILKGKMHIKIMSHLPTDILLYIRLNMGVNMLMCNVEQYSKHRAVLEWLYTLEVYTRTIRSNETMPIVNGDYTIFAMYKSARMRMRVYIFKCIYKGLMTL